MTPPFERQQADSLTRHHLLFERPEWIAGTESRQVRQLGAFVVGASRSTHDYLHNVIKPLHVPSRPVLSVVHDLGREYSGWSSDSDRISHILEEMVGFARSTPSPQLCHETLDIAVSLDAQMGIINFMKTIKPRNR